MIYRQNRRWVAWTELAIVLILLTAVHFIYHFRITDWSPNPLLFLVLYFAVRYGTLVGLGAAAGSAVLHLWLHYSKNGDLILFFQQWSQFKWLAAYVLLALFVGHYVSDRLFRYRLLAEEHDELKAQLTKVEQSYSDLLTVKQSLEKRIVGAQDSMMTLYKMAKALDSDDSEIIFTDAVRLFKDIIHAGSIVIYRLDSTSTIMRLKVCFGQDRQYASSVFLDQPSIYRRVFETRTIQLRMEGEDKAMPLLAGPIQGEHGEVIGIIGLDGLEFKTLTRQTADLFQLILQWMGESCVKAFRKEAALLNEQVFAGTRILRPEHFYNRLQEETLRASDFLQHFTLLQLPIDLSGHEETAALQEVDGLLQHTLREQDVVGYDAFRSELLFLLPATSPELKSLIEERIKKRFPEGV